MIALTIRCDCNGNFTVCGTRRMSHYPSSPRRHACAQVLCPTFLVLEDTGGEGICAQQRKPTVYIDAFTATARKGYKVYINCHFGADSLPTVEVKRSAA